MNDWRLPAIAAGAWVGGLCGPWVAHASAPTAVLWAGIPALVGVIWWCSRRWRLLAAVLGCGLAVATCAGLRDWQTNDGPVATLAADRAQVRLVVRVSDDPKLSHGRFGDRAVLHATALEVTGRGHTYALRTPVVIMADVEWLDLGLGQTVGLSGRLAPADGEVAALVSASGSPELLAGPDVWWRAADAVRSSMREVVAGRPEAQRALLPALVDGDDAAVSEELAADFNATGLTHLMAVSGTNLTIMLSFLLAMARLCGVRRRWLMLVGALGIAGFILIARTEPSVLRAAVMGSIGMIALSVGRVQALRTLSGSVVALLLIAPGLATSAGFALSVSATFGIVVWSPVWRDAMVRWMPVWLAEAIAVPTAAQLACTPLVAAISGQVSLVAVAANLIVEPVVGPATIGGLTAALIGLLWTPAGVVVAWPASLCVGWIAFVARRGADLPGAYLTWSTSPIGLVALTLVVAVVVWLGPRLVRRRWAAVAVALVLAVVLFVRVPRFGWPPEGWVFAVCDVGQGDALVLRAGPDAGVVVDAGPDPELVDRCLDDLGVQRVLLLVLTHFHADHIDGLAGILDGRAVEAIRTTSLLDPPEGVEEVNGLIGSVPVGPATAGEHLGVGDVDLQVLWPRPGGYVTGPGGYVTGPGDGSTANDASVVLLAQVRGVRILLTGDVEQPGQEAISHLVPGLGVDVLKIPHHGSANTDLDWLTSLGASIAIASVGADNDYGHPNPDLLRSLEAAGMRVWRTDTDGTVVVTRTGDGIGLAHSG